MAVFLYYPFVQNILNSFLKIRNLGGSPKGWNDPVYKNYIELFQDENIWTALKNTGIMILVTLFGEVGLAVCLAMMVDNIQRGAKVFRIVYFFPIVISATALGVLFNLIFQYDGGMLSQLAGSKVNWKELYPLTVMMAPVVWQYVGFYFVILVTGLNNIPDELYESAAIDGASRWQRVRYISWPLLHNVVCTCAVLAVTGALKVFDLPWVMFPNGAPLGKTWLTGTYMYYKTMQAPDIDYGSAIALVIVVLGVLLSKVVNLVFREKDY
ncbi:MAG: sugar ABC transporter permease [Eubacteriales bacterium]|nr:sugar ABC transporter permease [Eubacteriales bacterium]